MTGPVKEDVAAPKAGRRHLRQINGLRMVGIVDSLLTPIQKLIAAILPDFIEQELDDPEVRERIVKAVDKALVSGYPEAKLIPENIRQQIIRKLLDIMLDDILLPDPPPGPVPQSIPQPKD